MFKKAVVINDQHTTNIEYVDKPFFYGIIYIIGGGYYVKKMFKMWERKRVKFV